MSSVCQLKSTAEIRGEQKQIPVLRAWVSVLMQAACLMLWPYPKRTFLTC